MQKGYIGFDKRLKYLFDNATEVSYEQTLSSGTPIGTITIDGQSATVYAPSGGGSGSVSYTPVVTSGEQLGILSIDGVNNNIYAPTVEANPSGTATGNLSSIQIGNSIYDIVGGGSGGSGVPYTCDELFVNTTFDTTRSEITYTLNHSIDDYDAVLVTGYLYWNDQTSEHNQIASQLILKKDYYERASAGLSNNATFLLCGTLENSGRRIYFTFLDDTHLRSTYAYSYSGQRGFIYKVYGLKFSATIISPEIYSTEEREIGVFSDGKPLYEKIIELTKTDIGHAGNVDVSHGISNIDTPVSISRKEIRYGNGAMVSSYYYSSAWRLDVNDFGRTSIQVMIGDNVWNNMTANSKFAIGLQYTKTTDSPGSGTWTPEGQLAHHYSTSEHIVGTWIDGSPVYEITYSGLSVNCPNASTWYSTGIAYGNIKTIVGGFCGDSYGQMVSAVIGYTGTPKMLSVNCTITNRTIEIITLRYTKV